MAFDFGDVDIARMKQCLEHETPPYDAIPPASRQATATQQFLHHVSALTVYTQAIVCIIGTALGTILSTSSLAFVAALLLTRWLAPGAIHFDQPLYFDYSKPVVQGQALFGLPGSAPLLSAGQHADVWLSLHLPADDPFTPTFQVSAALQEHADAAAIARMSRAFRYQPPPRSMRQRLPWPLSPRPASSLTFVIPLFDDYVELPDTTMRVVQVAMLGRSGSDRVPEVLDAHVHVRLRLGWIRGLLHKIRPSLLMTALLLVTAACTASAGAVLALGAGLLLLLTVRGGANAPTTAAPTTAVPSSLEGAVDDDTSSVVADTADSEASSTHDMLDGEEGAPPQEGTETVQVTDKAAMQQQVDIRGDDQTAGSALTSFISGKQGAPPPGLSAETLRQRDRAQAADVL